MSYLALFWIVNLATAFLRLLIIGRLGLSGDEAHYWTYTQYLDLSYFDHPPLVAYMIKLSTLVFGQTEFAVRFPTVIIFLISSYLVFRIASKLFDEKTAFWSTVLLNVTPVFSFLGAVLTIPDAPLSLCWMLFIVLFWKMVQEERPRLWYALGALFGLGLLSKYNGILLAPSALMFLLFSRHRSWLRRKEPYIAVLIAAVIFLPTVIWNIQNNFASFGFQTKHGFGKTLPHFSLELLGRNLGAQAGYISPLLFFIFWAALFVMGKRAFKDRDEKALLIFSFSFPTLFLFNAVGSFNEILPHWPAMGYLVLAIPAAQMAIHAWKKPWMKATTIAAWSLGFILTVLVPLQAMFKILDPSLFLPKAEASKIEDGITKAEKVDITNELYGWPEVGGKIAEIIRNAPEPKPFVFTHRHYVASQLSFYIPGHPRVYCLSDRIDAYDFWQRDLSALNGRDGIFVTNDYFYVEPQKVFPFASWEKTVPVEIFRNGRKVRLFWLTEGRKFDLGKLPREFTSAPVGEKQSVKQWLRTIDYKYFWIINKKIDIPFVNKLMWQITRVDTSLEVNTGLLVLVALVGVILWFNRREKFWQEFTLAIGIIAVGGILVHILKDSVARMRPMYVFGEDAVRMFHEKWSNGSFPSGHTQIAFGVATYLTSRLKKYWWVFFSLAALMGLTRIYIGVHFPLDVVGGAVVGITVALVMINLIKID